MGKHCYQRHPALIYHKAAITDEKLQNKRLVVLRINVDLAIFHPYLDFEAGDNQSLKQNKRRLGISVWTINRLYHRWSVAKTRKIRVRGGYFIEALRHSLHYFLYICDGKFEGYLSLFDLLSPRLRSKLCGASSRFVDKNLHNVTSSLYVHILLFNFKNEREYRYRDNRRPWKFCLEMTERLLCLLAVT